MKKGTELTATISRMDYPNKGIIETDDGTIRVACALPGQTIRCIVKKFRSGSGTAILKEIVSPSPNEIKPKCPHFGKCGGCLYQSLPYEKELEIKEGQVRRLLTPVLDKQADDYELEPMLASPVYEGYRNKMEFTFGDEYKDGPLAIGMHRRASTYDIVTVTDCVIADKDYGTIIEATVRYFTERGVPYYHRVTHIGYLRHLLVRRTRTGEILVGLVTSGQEVDITQDNDACRNSFGNDTSETAVDITRDSSADSAQHDILSGYVDVLRALESDGQLNGHICGILHILNDSVADAVKADRVDILYGRDYITEELLGLTFRISTFSFFQTNTYGAEVLYSKVLEYVLSLDLSEDSTIYDLYSGTGTIAQIVAEGLSRGHGSKDADTCAAAVIGVELIEEAVAAARENAGLNGLNNCKFIAGDVLKVLDEMGDNDSLSGSPDLIILDPPRDGIHPKALPKILSYGARHIIYVSCKTTSLARDLDIILSSGYHVTKLCPIDQFPRTGGIETVVLLSKEDVKSKKIRVEFSLEDMDTDGFKKGAT